MSRMFGGLQLCGTDTSVLTCLTPLSPSYFPPCSSRVNNKQIYGEAFNEHTLCSAWSGFTQQLLAGWTQLTADNAFPAPEQPVVGYTLAGTQFFLLEVSCHIKATGRPRDLVSCRLRDFSGLPGSWLFQACLVLRCAAIWGVNSRGMTSLCLPTFPKPITLPFKYIK